MFPVLRLGRSLLAAPTVVAGGLGDAVRRRGLPFLCTRIALPQMGGDDVAELVQFHGTLAYIFIVFSDISHLATLIFFETIIRDGSDRIKVDGP